MIIDGFQIYRGRRLSEEYAELVYKGIAIGAYCDRGWIHKGLIELAKEHDIMGNSFRNSHASDVLSEIEKDRLCITSVTVGFNGGKMNNNGGVNQTGSHLIVVTGAVKENGVLQGFVINHPSSISRFNWENYLVNIEDLNNSFSGSFMSFWIK